MHRKNQVCVSKETSLQRKNQVVVNRCELKERKTSFTHKETDANMKQSGDENQSSEQNNAKRFTVQKQKFAPEIAVPLGKNSDGSAESLETPSSRSPPSPTLSGQFTYGYATNEAIPMTVFYRSQHSQGHNGKQRPTLQQLRKGFENDKVRELVMSDKLTLVF